MIWKGTSEPKKKLGLLNMIWKVTNKPKKKLQFQNVISKGTKEAMKEGREDLEGKKQLTNEQMKRGNN